MWRAMQSEIFKPDLMQTDRQYSTRLLRNTNTGFALVITLSLMILLTVIAVGLLSLSAISLRQSAQTDPLAVAQANARMALMLAIGELQHSLGPDTRVSANAKILEKSGVSISDPLEQITGVWEAWRPSPTSIGNYDQKKSALPQELTNSNTDGLPQPMGGFHRWLTSTSDPTKTSDINFPKTGSLVQPIELVKSPGTSLPGVQAEKVTLKGASRPQGSIAWAVFDEGQKISATLGKPSTTGTPLERLANQDSPAWKNVTAWNKFATISAADRDKLVSFQTTQLQAVGNLEPGSFSYDLTTNSSGLLADVTLGKLRTDLSLLFAEPDLPSDYNSRYLYSNTTTPLAPAVSRGAHPHAWPSPDPKWSLLHKFYRIPDDNSFSTDGSNASITIDFNKIPDRLTTSTPTKANPLYNDAIKLSPVISKAQFFFSLSLCHPDAITSIWKKTGGEGYKRTNTSDTPNTESPFYLATAMIIDPVITLWNPYDVPIKVPEFLVYLYRLPLQFKFDVIPSGPQVWKMDPSKSQFSKFSDMISNSPPAGTDNALAYPLRIMPPNGAAYIEMHPGEHVVFSVYRKITGSNDIGNATTTSDPGANIILQPGWYAPNPGGSNASLDLTAGGIGTQNLCKDGTSNSAQYQNYTGGMPNGTWTNTMGIPMRIGDKLAVTVGPYSRSTSTFNTLGNNPVDFYLRYGKYSSGSRLIDSNHEFMNEADFGAIELSYGSNISTYIKTFSSSSTGALALPYYSYTMADLNTCGYVSPYKDQKFYTNADTATKQYWGAKMKKPFCVGTLHLKSLVGADTARNNFPSKAWINNNPAAIYASNGLGNQAEDQASQQYEFSLEKLDGSWQNGVPEVTLNPATGRYNGYGGPSSGATYGRLFAPFISIPRVHATSIAQLRHAPLNQSGKLPLQAQVLANSFAHPLMSADAVIDPTKGYLDHSFLANNLFDRAFFSSAESGQNIIDLATSGTPLINSRMMSYGTPNETLLEDVSINYNYSAANLLVNGAFNVNSTSENAWKAFLTAINGSDIPVLESLKDTTFGKLPNTDQDAHTSRFTIPIAQRLGDELDPTSGTTKPAWNGYRKLDQTQITALAKSIVEEVKKRGPFQSLAEFINRRAEKSTLGQMGALQAAIEQSGINDASINDTNSPSLTGTEPGSSSYLHKDAAKGSPLTGAPGYLLQGDLLNSMAPFIAVRSDTFKIRTYGEALDPSGTKVTAKAWCEATVQRLPDYVDSTANTASDHLGTDSATPLSAINKTFGRRFQVVSFRWLNQQDL